MNTTIYLTRHGQTLWNLEKRLQGRGNSPLTEDGIERAKELRDRLKNIHIDIIYSSPIERAFETAKIIKGDKDVEIITDDGFMEMCFGDYEGRKTDEVMKENPNWDIGLIMKGNTELSAPNGENLNEVRARVANTMNKIIKANIGKTILDFESELEQYIFEKMKEYALATYNYGNLKNIVIENNIKSLC